MSRTGPQRDHDLPRCAFVTRAGGRCDAPVRGLESSQTLCADHRSAARARARDDARRLPPATRVLAVDAAVCAICPRAATHERWCRTHYGEAVRYQRKRGRRE